MSTQGALKGRGLPNLRHASASGQQAKVANIAACSPAALAAPARPSLWCALGFLGFGVDLGFVTLRADTNAKPWPGSAMTPIVGAEKAPFTLAQLVVFRMVARTGTFAAAALALSISPPAVSKTMATLEQARAARSKARFNTVTVLGCSAEEVPGLHVCSCVVSARLIADGRRVVSGIELRIAPIS